MSGEVERKGGRVERQEKEKGQYSLGWRRGKGREGDKSRRMGKLNGKILIRMKVIRRRRLKKIKKKISA